MNFHLIVTCVSKKKTTGKSPSIVDPSIKSDIPENVFAQWQGLILKCSLKCTNLCACLGGGGEKRTKKESHMRKKLVLPVTQHVFSSSFFVHTVLAQSILAVFHLRTPEGHV